MATLVEELLELEARRDCADCARGTPLVYDADYDEDVHDLGNARIACHAAGIRRKIAAIRLQ